MKREYSPPHITMTLHARNAVNGTLEAAILLLYVTEHVQHALLSNFEWEFDDAAGTTTCRVKDDGLPWGKA